MLLVKPAGNGLLASFYTGIPASTDVLAMTSSTIGVPTFVIQIPDSKSPTAWKASENGNGFWSDAVPGAGCDTATDVDCSDNQECDARNASPPKVCQSINAGTSNGIKGCKVKLASGMCPTDTRTCTHFKSGNGPSCSEVTVTDALGTLIKFDMNQLKSNLYIKFTGQIYAPSSGDYFFQATVDGDAAVYIAGNLVVTAKAPSGSTSPTAVRVTSPAVNLQKGWIPYRMDFVENLSGLQGITITVRKPGQTEFVSMRGMFKPEGSGGVEDQSACDTSGCQHGCVVKNKKATCTCPAMTKVVGTNCFLLYSTPPSRTTDNIANDGFTYATMDNTQKADQTSSCSYPNPVALPAGFTVPALHGPRLKCAVNSDCVSECASRWAFECHKTNGLVGFCMRIIPDQTCVDGGSGTTSQYCVSMNDVPSRRVFCGRQSTSTDILKADGAITEAQAEQLLLDNYMRQLAMNNYWGTDALVGVGGGYYTRNILKSALATKMGVKPGDYFHVPRQGMTGLPGYGAHVMRAPCASSSGGTRRQRRVLAHGRALNIDADTAPDDVYQINTKVMMRQAKLDSTGNTAAARITCDTMSPACQYRQRKTPGASHPVTEGWCEDIDTTTGTRKAVTCHCPAGYRLKADLRNCERVSDQPTCGGAVHCCQEVNSGSAAGKLLGYIGRVGTNREDILEASKCSGAGKKLLSQLKWNSKCVMSACPETVKEDRYRRDTVPVPTLAGVKQNFKVTGGDYRFIRKLPTKRHTLFGMESPIFVMDDTQLITIGADNFNAMFEASKTRIIKRVCKKCDANYRKMFYRRHTPVPAALNMYDLFTLNWIERNNAMGLDKDFTIHSSYQDALSGKYAWQFCNFDDPGGPVGFPRDCAKTDPGVTSPTSPSPLGAKNGQWMTTNEKRLGGQKIVSLFIDAANDDETVSQDNYIRFKVRSPKNVYISLFRQAYPTEAAFSFRLAGSNAAKMPGEADILIRRGDVAPSQMVCASRLAAGTDLGRLDANTHKPFWIRFRSGVGARHIDTPVAAQAGLLVTPRTAMQFGYGEVVGQGVMVECMTDSCATEADCRPQWVAVSTPDSSADFVDFEVGNVESYMAQQWSYNLKGFLRPKPFWSTPALGHCNTDGHYLPAETAFRTTQRALKHLNLRTQREWDTGEAGRDHFLGLTCEQCPAETYYEKDSPGKGGANLLEFGMHTQCTPCPHGHTTFNRTGSTRCYPCRSGTSTRVPLIGATCVDKLWLKIEQSKDRTTPESERIPYKIKTSGYCADDEGWKDPATKEECETTYATMGLTSQKNAGATDQSTWPRCLLDKKDWLEWSTSSCPACIGYICVSNTATTASNISQLYSTCADMPSSSYSTSVDDFGTTASAACCRFGGGERLNTPCASGESFCPMAKELVAPPIPSWRESEVLDHTITRFLNRTAYAAAGSSKESVGLQADKCLFGRTDASDVNRNMIPFTSVSVATSVYHAPYINERSTRMLKTMTVTNLRQNSAIRSSIPLVVHDCLPSGWSSGSGVPLTYYHYPLSWNNNVYTTKDKNCAMFWMPTRMYWRVQAYNNYLPGLKKCSDPAASTYGCGTDRGRFVSTGQYTDIATRFFTVNFTTTRQYTHNGSTPTRGVCPVVHLATDPRASTWNRPGRSSKDSWERRLGAEGGVVEEAFCSEKCKAAGLFCGSDDASVGAGGGGRGTTTTYHVGKRASPVRAAWPRMPALSCCVSNNRSALLTARPNLLSSSQIHLRLHTRR